MNKNRILLLTNRVPYPLNDGGARAMDAMVRGYKQAGWEVMLFSMNTRRHHVPAQTLISHYGNIHVELFDMDSDVRLLPLLRNFLFSREPNHAERFYKESYKARLVDLIASWQPGLIQLESIYLAAYLPDIRHSSNARVLIRLHNIEFHIWERLAAETSGLLKKYYLKDLARRIRRFEIKAWTAADVLLPITDVDAVFVKAEGISTEMITVPYGVDMDHIQSTPDPVDWSGYHLGAMDWLPNAEGISWFLKDIWPGLHQAAPSFRFFFAGRGMPASFRSLKIDGVVCAGEVPDADAFIAGKMILIVPLRSGSGVRIKIIEAMAAGKLVISTSIGMQGIPAGAGTHFLLADTPAEFISQVVWALDHRPAAVQIALRGAAMIRSHYDQGRIMSDLVKILESDYK